MFDRQRMELRVPITEDNIRKGLLAFSKLKSGKILASPRIGKNLENIDELVTFLNNPDDEDKFYEYCEKRKGVYECLPAGRPISPTLAQAVIDLGNSVLWM